MKKNETSAGRLKSIDQTLKGITRNKKAPKGLYVLLLAMHFAASFIVRVWSASSDTVTIAGQTVGVYSFSGVLTALANMCVIVMVVYFGKLGFYTALTILMIQFPLVLSNILIRHNFRPLPGLFNNLFTIFVIVIIYVNHCKVDKFQERLRDQAATDTLTGLPNRFACTELINSLVDRKTEFAVVSVDLNNFKSINDTMGHNTGNEILKEIAERWKKVANERLSGTYDFVARLGGDEYAIILRSYVSDDDLLRAIRYYQSVLEEKMIVDGCDLYISGSFGYAVYPRDADNGQTLTSYADTAMYKAKRSKSSHIVRFTNDMLEIEHTLEIEGKIRAALKDNTIYYNLQPQFDISHGLRGFEALARMKDTDGKIISPGEFIPVAENAGLIDKVDAAVFRGAAKFFGELIRKTGVDITLSVNVSVRHLMKNDFLDELKEIINTCGIPAGQLEIEITESIMIDSAEKALQCIKEIRGMGIKIAIDDFGTGYSSLSYLNNFPADLLKVDKSFIDRMNISDTSKQYVEAIISIGHIMNFDVISEGVEEEEQLETLRSIGCDYIQGFIWGRPLSPEDAEKLVMASVSA
ncbi:MAG: EAL domain-containing protein [Oscillospiraceae bacterium]|nr:EAL domain-containing protein [Oscillospiraceae bacterium]